MKPEAVLEIIEQIEIAMEEGFELYGQDPAFVKLCRERAIREKPINEVEWALLQEIYVMSQRSYA